MRTVVKISKRFDLVKKLKRLKNGNRFEEHELWNNYMIRRKKERERNRSKLDLVEKAGKEGKIGYKGG